MVHFVNLSEAILKNTFQIKEALRSSVNLFAILIGFYMANGMLNIKQQKRQ